jgi:misacylated tRNA(Ala) deacylase
MRAASPFRLAIFTKTRRDYLCSCVGQEQGIWWTMLRTFYHEHPQLLTLEAEVLEAEPGRVRLSQSPFYPGGGGQLADRGLVRTPQGEYAIAGFEEAGGRLWHLLTEPVELKGTVQAVVDSDFRLMMSQLHTDTHILNAVIFQEFNGALVTGVQMHPDGTARMDFDLPGVDNARLRLIEDPINAAIRQDLAVSDSYMPLDDVLEAHGLIRTKSAMPPPTADGMVRIVEIKGLDRQACGGTHLASTGRSGSIKILKIDNKGRNNRRVKIGLADHLGR